MKYLLFLLLVVYLEANNMNSLLYNGNCITCHKDTKEESAPSMYEVKSRYLSAFAEKKDFIAYMSKWVSNPNKETSLMHDAIKKHDLMPSLGFDEDMLKDIATHIYETDFKTNGGRYWSN
jgi:cytochrome c551/c552